MLRTHYRTYLENGASPRHAAPLANELQARGLSEEGELLRAFSLHGAGTYSFRSATLPGGEAFVGARPPIASPGAWWMDSCDLSLNILLAPYVDPGDWEVMTEEARQRAKRSLTWFAVRPVAVYQYLTFLEVAPIEYAPGKSSVQEMFDVASAGGISPITSLTVHAASLYLYWYGKTFSSDEDWMSIGQMLDIAPWSSVPREWSGESGFNSAYAVAISANTFRTDPADTEDEQDPDKRMLFGESEARSDTTFRPVVRLAYGLRLSSTPSSCDEAGRRVLRSYPR